MLGYTTKNACLTRMNIIAVTAGLTGGIDDILTCIKLPLSALGSEQYPAYTCRFSSPKKSLSSSQGSCVSSKDMHLPSPSWNRGQPDKTHGSWEVQQLCQFLLLWSFTLSRWRTKCKDWGDGPTLWYCSTLRTLGMLPHKGSQGSTC